MRITAEILDQHGVATQEDLARLLGTSIRTVRRDIAYRPFGRVVALNERGRKEAAEIARYASISERLATEYLELYSKQRQKLGCSERIKDLLAPPRSQL